MITKEYFRVSTHLKDIIGRDLVTNQFVAVFELVKNSFDANASRVDIGFDLDESVVWIADDGKGMDADTLRDRWLFVAYSAKAEGTEDSTTQSNYRDRIRPQGRYAGSKGIGRFSCDTLGKRLILCSRTSSHEETHKLSVEWEHFEEDRQQLFHTIGVTLESVDGFPKEAPIGVPSSSGTVLKIEELRSNWSTGEIERLRLYLEKLIDPFGSTQNIPVYISVFSNELTEKRLQALGGPIGNNISNLLSEKTTRIEVEFDGGQIRTELVDRGTTVYRISERNQYEGLADTSIRASIYFLNRSAKNNFKRRMGVTSVSFGSIFLFLNGFRVFPIGEETDDTLRLNRRKQQGTTRYLGTRDVMGRVDVIAPHKLFRETSSRDAGLIEDANVRDLYKAIQEKMIVRLERYVVGVTWPDREDKFRDDASGLAIITTQERVIDLIGQIASVKDLKLEYYNHNIVKNIEEETTSLHRVMESLTAIAEHREDTQLISRLKEARAKQAELEQSEQEASAAARRARIEKMRADERIASLEQQATYLAATQDMTVEQMTLLLHQVVIYSGHIGAGVDRGLANAKKIKDAAIDIESGYQDGGLADAAAVIRVANRDIADNLDYIHLENDRLMTVGRFASNARFELRTDHLYGDIVVFLDNYINHVCGIRDGVDLVEFESNNLSLYAKFRPVDLVIVVDNLMDNARRHAARKMRFSARLSKSEKFIEVLITDDGRGLDERRIDPAHIFDKGYTSTRRGTGLGLYHARKIIEEMGGVLQLDPHREQGRASFIISLPRKIQ